jgi:hypothetical protein
MALAVGATEDRDRPLPVGALNGTPEEIERQWYEQVYRGRGDRMAWRAVLVGSCLGGVLSLTNLYIGLKAGWGFGVAITASILSYAIWTSLLKVGLARTPMTILENNCMQSTASSAGYSTGGTLISAFAAYIIVNHQSISVPLMLAWIFFIAVLGVTMAIPMKRQMINIEQLRFPFGIQCRQSGAHACPRFAPETFPRRQHSCLAPTSSRLPPPRPGLLLPSRPCLGFPLVL